MTTNTMAAAVYRRFGSPDVVHVEQILKPTPKAGEVLIKVHSSTVSAADHRARSRDIPPGLGILAAIGIGLFRPSHHVLGMDVAGVVEAVGADVITFTPVTWLSSDLRRRSATTFGAAASSAATPSTSAFRRTAPSPGRPPT